MECKFADRLTCDDNADSGIGDFLDYLFELDFFSLGEFEHFLGVVEEDGSFCFCLADVDGTGEDAYFCITRFLDDALVSSVWREVVPEGSREKTIPLTTVLSSRPPPMTFTTRMLSTLKAEGFLGMTCKTDLATSLLRKSSLPYCFEAIVDLIALAISSSDFISSTLSIANSALS